MNWQQTGLPGIQRSLNLKYTVRKSTRAQFLPAVRLQDRLVSSNVVWSPMVLSRRKGKVGKVNECAATASRNWDGFRDEDAAREGPSTELGVIVKRIGKLAKPYWVDSKVGTPALLGLAFVIALTVGKTGVSVAFNFLERDFTNALAAKDVPLFQKQLLKYLGAFVWGIPVLVFATFFKGKVALSWRKWMTEKFMNQYLSKRTFYNIQTKLPLDNPDQRITMDIKIFTDTALTLMLTTLNAVVNLMSFSKILFTIYPPLFATLFVYAVGGTTVSLLLGKKLVGLNFQQEAREADFRFGLIRLRENAENIAFYGGEKKEENLIVKRLGHVVDNAGELLRATRIVDFFSMFYRYLICLLPAAVIAPLYFRGEIQLGVVTQSEYAFMHVLDDVSLVVFQLKTLAGFSAVVDRLGQFQEVMDSCVAEDNPTNGVPKIEVQTETSAMESSDCLLKLEQLTLLTPNSGAALIKNLSLEVVPGRSLLIMGPSGGGKTSLLRAIAGLWTAGDGKITRFGRLVGIGAEDGEILFVPQKPYLVLGSLRDQLLYPTWAESFPNGDSKSKAGRNSTKPVPSDAELLQMMATVNLSKVMERCQKASKKPLDAVADWSVQLSLGEQQRLAFARVLLSKPKLVIMDEASSALDVKNEEMLYEALKLSGTTFVSVGHRPTLQMFHEQVLEITPSNETNPEPQWKIRTATEVQLGIVKN